MKRMVMVLWVCLTLFPVIGPIPAQAAQTLTVLYFDNNTGQDQYDTLGKGLADMLITDLTQSSGLQVVEREKLEALIGELKLQKTKYFDPRTIQKLGKGVGADLALAGAFFIAGNDVRIDTRVVEVSTGKILAADKVQGPTDRFFELQKQLTEAFIKGLGNRLSKSARENLSAGSLTGRVTRLSSAAAYAQALDQADQGDFQTAADALKKVAEQEPDFKLARSRSAEMLEKLLEMTRQVKETATRIDERTEKMAQSMEKIAQGFEALAKQGGLIPNPETAEEFYHNARLYELKSDYGNARKMYLKYFTFDLDFVDPHLNFQTFLKVQEGREGAREVYEYIAKSSKSMVTEFAAALLLPQAQRTPRIQAFLEKQPDFAPGYYELSKDHSEVRLGKQTLDDKKQEKALLDRFTELDKSGKLVRYFMDKKLVAEYRQDAEDRLAALKFMAPEAMENPVKVVWMKTNSGWMGTVTIAEMVVDILVKEEGQTQFKSLGHQDYLNPQTGQRIPNQTITLPLTDKPVKFQIKYLDVQKKERGPYEAVLNPQAADISATKKILELTRTAWISYGRNNNKTLAYFTHLMSYRGAIAEIRYGLDMETPDKKYEFPYFSGAGTATIDDKVPTYYALPPNTRFMSVQITYKDGDKSEVQKFPVPEK